MAQTLEKRIDSIWDMNDKLFDLYKEAERLGNYEMWQMVWRLYVMYITTHAAPDENTVDLLAATEFSEFAGTGTEEAQEVVYTALLLPEEQDEFQRVYSDSIVVDTPIVYQRRYPFGWDEDSEEEPQVFITVCPAREVG